MKYHPKPLLTGLNTALRSREGRKNLIIVEGVIDTITLPLVHGLPNVAALNGPGTILNEKRWRELARLKVARVILALDHDKSGIEGCVAALNNWAKVSGAPIPYVVPMSRFRRHKDPDELARHEGIEALEEVLAKPVHGLRYLAKYGLVRKHRDPDGGWSDMAVVQLADDVVDFVARLPKDREPLLKKVFYPTLRRACPDLDLASIKQQATVERVKVETKGRGTPVIESLPNAPVDQRLVIPKPYYVDNGCLFLAGGKDRPPIKVATAPVLVTGQLSDIDSGDSWVRLTWLRPKAGWLSAVVPRADAVGQKIIDLAGKDFPVTINNTRLLTKYVEAAEDANREVLPRLMTSAHMGWQGRTGNKGFVWGKSYITTDGELVAIDPTEGGTDQWEKGAVAFVGPTEGEQQISRGLKAVGDHAEWLEAVDLARHYPRVQVPLYASFVPPLQRHLGIPNFIVHLMGVTSCGKTTGLRLGQSVWGNPDETRPDSAMRSWDTTQVAAERTAAAMTDLPLVLDELGRVDHRDRERVQNVIYLVAQGRGRDRGSVDGLRKTGSFHSVALSSGEVPVESFSKAGGVSLRVLTISKLPFKERSKAAGKLAAEINEIVKANFGHAGPAFVQWLAANRDEKLVNWQRLYAKRTQWWSNKLSKSPGGSRMAAYLAAIDVAGKLVHRADVLPDKYESPVERIWEELTQQSRDPLNAARAFVYVLDRAASEQAAFHGKASSDAEGVERIPYCGWLGSWDSKHKLVCMYPDKLEGWLRGEDYEPDAVVAEWANKGWLKTSNGRRKYKKRINGQQTWCYAVRLDAAQEADKASR